LRDVASRGAASLPSGLRGSSEQVRPVAGALFARGKVTTTLFVARRARGARDMADPLVSHISDTARWVAAYRAIESARPDALFRDPLAERLAGETGRRIEAAMPREVRRHSWAMVMRTKAIDDLVLEGIGGGVDRVLNLAAGLDTRPYRLLVPSTLRWVEADLPGIVDEKERMLQRETPRCVVTRERVDLSDRVARGAFLERALDGSGRALVITEGLLVYLDDDAVGDLAADLASRPAVRSWVTDILSRSLLKRMRGQLNARLSADAEMRFAPDNGVAFFAPFGWRPAVVRSLLLDAVRTRRAPWFLRPLALLPQADPTRPGRRPWSAVVRLDRDAHSPAPVRS
jgi:methyltransferase (TIGR00027 family)